MNPKEYLMQYKRLTRRIENAELDLQAIREERESISISLDGLPKATGTSDRVANLAVMLADAEAEIIAMRSEAWSMRMEIIRTIDKMENPAEVRLLHLRYVDGYTWEQIAVDMDYTYQWVCGSLHGNALKSLDKILNGGCENE